MIKYDDEYLKTLAVDISHKIVATRAGLGWIGKIRPFHIKGVWSAIKMPTNAGRNVMNWPDKNKMLMPEYADYVFLFVLWVRRKSL